MSDDFFLYEEADIPWNEKEKIRHEINTNYRKYWGLPMIVHRSVGFDGDYYLYYVENKGFDSYRFFARIKDLDEEDEDGQF